MGKYTPKHWNAKKFFKNSQEKSFEIWDNHNKKFIAEAWIECPYGHDCPSEEEAEANANLIAAAPDMYEALKEFFKLLEGDKAPKWRAIAFYDIAKKALAKAEGRGEDERL